MEKTIYELELHETLITESNLTITRVPGGWIYRCPVSRMGEYDNAIFVPFNDEYSKNKKPKLPESYDFTPPDAVW